MTQLAGRRLGRYEIQQEIGRGGMARVYRARDTLLQRPVAIKVMASHLSADPEFARRFEREAITAANLHHPAIVTVYDVGEQDGMYYIAMEFVQGRTLHAILEDRDALGLGYAVSILDPVARALDYAHSRSAVHRDVKPHNILIDIEGRVLLTDFGIAQRPDADKERLTRTGMFMGTPEYISPEQAEARRVDGRSDLYSLAVVAYEIITGRVPFSGATPQLLIAHSQTPPPPPSRIAPHVPPELDVALTRALQKNPEARFSNGATFVAALQAVARSYGTPLASTHQIADLIQPFEVMPDDAGVASQSSADADDRYALVTPKAEDPPPTLRQSDLRGPVPQPAHEPSPSIPTLTPSQQAISQSESLSDSATAAPRPAAPPPEAVEVAGRPQRRGKRHRESSTSQTVTMIALSLLVVGLLVAVFFRNTTNSPGQEAEPTPQLPLLAVTTEPTEAPPIPTATPDEPPTPTEVSLPTVNPVPTEPVLPVQPTAVPPREPTAVPFPTETAPPEETAPVDTTPPPEETAPVDATAPPEETIPPEETAPAEETAAPPTENPAPTDTNGAYPIGEATAAALTPQANVTTVTVQPTAMPTAETVTAVPNEEPEPSATAPRAENNATVEPLDTAEPSGAEPTVDAAAPTPAAPVEATAVQSDAPEA